jgi:hypothetical protein
MEVQTLLGKFGYGGVIGAIMDKEERRANDGRTDHEIRMRPDQFVVSCAD